MQAVMITMVGREESALASAEQLLSAGVSTEIFVQPSDWPVGGEGNNRNSRRALKWAIENVTDPGVIFAEDDIVVKPDRFRRALKAADEVGKLMYFYMHDIPPRTDGYPKEAWIQTMVKENQYRNKNSSDKLAEIIAPEGPRLMKPGTRMFGSQCVYIPTTYLPFFHAYMDNGIEYSAKIRSQNTEAVDTSLNNWVAENRLDVYCYLPHPAQHLQNRKLRNGRRIDVYSSSFDLVSDLEVGHE